ncbi:MAG: hypothetical protein RL497_1655 [Pseudomonadota bacterium]|jgi:hypothetical protein
MMNNAKFTVQNGLCAINGNEVFFPYSVTRVQEASNIFVIMVEPPAGVIFNRNIFGCDSNGEILWQIQESPHGWGDNKSYFEIFQDGSGGVVATRIGINYQVNINDGSVAPKSFNRF